MNVKALALKAWAAEPVLVSTVPPILVSTGIIAASQSTAVGSAIASGLALVVQLGGVFAARSQVAPPAK